MAVIPDCRGGNEYARLPVQARESAHQKARRIHSAGTKDFFSLGCPSATANAGPVEVYDRVGGFHRIHVGEPTGWVTADVAGRSRAIGPNQTSNGVLFAAQSFRWCCPDKYRFTGNQ